MVAVTVSESRKMSALSVRSPGVQAVAAGLLDSRSLRLRGITALDGVRRNLFGCTDAEENRRFVERELSRQLELGSERWGFDFAQERPLPGAQRFAWQLVPAAAVPVPFRRAPGVSVAPPSVAPAPPPSAPAPPAHAPPAITSAGSPGANIKPQKRITDFMKPRKRLTSSSAKKSSPGHKHDCSGHGTHLRPPKVARLAQTHFKS